ncbi:MAG TPA: glycoside hydrolase family 97 N-terminal domain-containing protein, partial [Flavitalea sp.]|nr:glycoside hydrolase family 97 N-terminal domain-containing protein [Flavitalea sp.]
MSRSAIITFLLSLFLNTVNAQLQLESPDKKLKAVLTPGSDPANFVQYRLILAGKTLISSSSIGLKTEMNNGAKFSMLHAKRSSYSSQWKPLWGERNIVPEKYNQIVMSFTSSGQPDVQIVCRMYNEGFAFRYKVFSRDKNEMSFEELSVFNFTPQSVAWFSNTAQGMLSAKTIAESGNNLERPLTVKLQKNVYMALGEAGLVDYPRMKFEGKAGNKIIAKLFENPVLRDSLVSPWRYIIIGNAPGELLSKNYLLLNLNEKSQIANPDWIRPGKVIREVSLTTQGAFNTIDFAASHKLSYILFDAGWYGREDHDSSDASHVALDPLRSKGPLDLQKVIAYGKTKNIGVILYVNRRALERQLDTLLPLYKSWGIKGLKFGFVQVGSGRWTSWLHNAVRKAAAYNMIVDIHDEYRPTG